MNLLEIWKQICESNMFNFIVMILLLAWIVTKCNIGQMIENGRKKIEDCINDSEKAKEDSLNKLYEVQAKATTVDEDILNVLKKAENNANDLGKKIIDDVKVQSEVIKESTKKAIEANTESAKNTVISDTAELALVLAKENIVEQLKQDPDLHIKLINESIDAINEIGAK